jgi:RNase P subunit RPR2
MALRSPDLSSTHHAVCDQCGHPVDIVDRVRDYSTTRGPMAEHVVTRCGSCGQREIFHVAAQVLGGRVR